MSGRRDAGKSEQSRRPSDKGTAISERHGAHPDDGHAQGWQTLQRTLGNQGTQRAIERERVQLEQQRAQREDVTAVSGDTQERIDSLGGKSSAIETPEASFHVGPEVDQVAHSLGARAFTQGRDVFLGSRGQDRATVAHELTHVSQGQTGAGMVQMAPEEPEEIEMPAMDIEREKAMADALNAVAEMDAREAADEQAEKDEEEQRQVSMSLPGPGKQPTYVTRPKKRAPAPHETLDPRTEAIIEGKLIQDDTGRLVNPSDPINAQERAERAWDQRKWDEGHRQKKQEAMQARVQALRESGKINRTDPGFREGVAIDLINGGAPEAPFATTPSTGGEPESSDLPTLTVNKPDASEAKQEPEPFVPPKYSFSLTIDNITTEYQEKSAEEAITELKWRWTRVRDLIDVYKEWHHDILKNRADHPVVGFVVDVAGRREPPDIRIWDELENNLGETMKVIDLDVAQLRSDFEAKERKREEDEKRADEERIAQGGTSLLKFRGINPKWGTKADWESYMDGHMRGAVQALQRAAHRVESRRKAVFYYKEGTIQTTEQAIKVLQHAKEAGSFAASFIPGARYVYEGAAELATQTGEWLADSDADFDWGKIGRATVTGAVTNFIGGKVGGRLGRAFEGALTKVVTRVLGAKATNYVVNNTTKAVIKYLSEYGSNVATNPLNTALNATLQIAMDDPNRPKNWDEFENRLASELERAVGPRGIIESVAGTHIGNRIQASEGPTQNFGYTETAPSLNTGAQASPPSGDVAPVAGSDSPPQSSSAPAPATVVENTTAPTAAPVAETPRAARAETGPSVDIAPPRSGAAPTSNQRPRRRPRTQPPPIPDAARASRTRRDTQVDDIHTRQTREVPTVNEAPTQRMRAVGPDETQPVSDRTQEIPIQDRPTEQQQVQEPVGERRDDGDMGPTYGPVEPWVHEMPDMTVMRDANPRDPVAATKMYEQSVGDNRTVEAALYYNPVTGEYIIVQGNEGTAAVAPDQGPIVGREQRWKEVLDSPDVGRWELVRHSHPSDVTGNVAPVNQVPSGADGDFSVLVGESVANGGEPRTSVIDYLTPDGKRQTEFGFDPNLDRPFWFQLPDGGPRIDFRTIEQYHQYLDSTFPGQARRPDIPPWMSGSNPVQHSRQAAQRANRPTEPLPIQQAAPDTTTQRVPAQGPDGTTQRVPIQGPDGTTQRVPTQDPGGTTRRVPTQDPDGTTERVPTQGPGGTTQRMTQQGPIDPYANTQDMPAVGGREGRSLPSGPLEVVPVENVSDARILMQEWPGNRPMRLLSNGEAKRAWNQDYGQLGDPPPAWMDPRNGLVVDADQIPPPSARDTYHVPAEDPYVMFNVPTAQEAISIYRQNEAANAINPATSARSFLLDHDTFLHVFQQGRGYSPTPPAAFVDQNGRLYVDISKVDVATSGQGGGGSNAPSGVDINARTESMTGQTPAGAPMPQGDMRATEAMSPQAPIGQAPPLPQNARRTSDDDLDSADTGVVTPQGPVPQPGAPGTPRRRDEKKTAPMGKVDAAAIAQRRIQGAEYISKEGVKFFHATNRAIVRLNQILKSRGIPWASDGGALWITKDAGSAFFGSNQVSPARTRQIYERYGITWDADAARLANEPAYFEVDISRLPSVRDASDVAADFAEGGNGRTGVNTDYTIKDLTGSPFDAMREISGPGPGAAPKASGKASDSEPVSVPGDEGRASTLPQESPPPQPINESVAAPSVAPRNGPPTGSGGPPPGPARPYESMGPDINPYSTLMPVQRIDDPVQAAQTYQRFLNMPEQNRGRVRAMETAEFQDAWQRSPGFDMAPDRPAPVAWIDTHGNLIVDFDRANLERGMAPAGPTRPAEDIAYPEPEARSYPRDTYGVYQPGVPRGVSREIYNVGEAQQIWTDQVMARRHVRFVRYEQTELVDLWQHGYGGQGDRPPLAWLDGQGFLVVDMNRVPFPEAVWEHEARTGPL